MTPLPTLPAANDPARVAEQYRTDRHLHTRIQTHRLYGVGRELEDQVDDLLALTGTEALLDVGSGPGHFPGRLHAAGHRGRLVGADLSDGMVQTAQGTYPEVEFVQAGADALPFEGETFEVLTARHMLYHVPSVPAALAEFRRVLRPGGRFLAVTNAARYMPELWEVVEAAARLEPALGPLAGTRGSVAAAFSETNGEAWVREAFGHAQLSFSDQSLIFSGPQPVLDYLASHHGWLTLNEDEQASGRVALKTVLEGRFRHGPWMVSKRTAFLVAGG
ncbi:class I SAM-dependent methyltransferase [Deinococcus sp.]|uniref:class I SAM-dependent methyltransferase n=1 Tax=Deinococcus sp. TaxID=47478 RepID=UPI003C7B5A27